MNVNKTFDGAASGENPEILPQAGEGQIILCDVNGTLLLNGENSAPVINTPLVYFLLAAEDRGYQVQLHSTTGQISMQFRLLARRNAALAEYMSRRNEDDLFIFKDDIPTKTALLTIDDEHGGAFNSQAPNQWYPKDSRIQATMAAWGVSELPTPTAAKPDAASGPK